LKRFLFSLLLILSTSIFAKNDKFQNLYTCFDVNKVKVEIEWDKVQWPGTRFVDVCSIGLTIDRETLSYFYFSRGWRYPKLCTQFMSDWSYIRKNNKKVCIAARLDPPRKKIKNGKHFLERTAPYEVIKSGSWCHSYFDGYCE
jgi:hypothetical protein